MHSPSLKNYDQNPSGTTLQEEKKIDKALEILGEFYGADKAYFFLLNPDNKTMVQSNHWTKQEGMPTISESNLVLDPGKMFDWLNTRNEAGIIEIDKTYGTYRENSMEGNILNAFHLDNLVISVMEDVHHQPVGVFLVHNRSKQVRDLRVLQSITRFMERGSLKGKYQIAQEKRMERDKLTGLYNRASYATRLEELNQNLPKSLGIFLADVNGLKKSNAEYGYEKGDALIQKASKIMAEHFGSELYRIAGDEFVGFFPDIDEKEFEKRIISLNQHLRKEENYLLFAIGHAWGTGRYTCRNLIHEADTKMFIDKQEYYHCANCRMEEITDSTLAELFSHLDDEEFMIYLQPQVRLKDSALRGGRGFDSSF